MSGKNFGAVRQIGYLVEDIESGIAAWKEHANVGPWTWIKNIPLDCVYKGEPATPIIDIGLSFCGDVQIELIQQKNAVPSPYRQFFEEKRFGIHHTAYLCDDINGDIEWALTQGMELVCDIKMFDGSRYAYLVNAAMGDGILLELIENTDMMKQMFASGIDAAANYDGSVEDAVMDLARS